MQMVPSHVLRTSETESEGTPQQMPVLPHMAQQQPYDTQTALTGGLSSASISPEEYHPQRL